MSAQSPEQVAIPDIRQSICHTLLAGGFLIINLQNPFRQQLADTPLTLLIMVAMPVAAFVSWLLFAHRLEVWRRFPTDTRNRITRSPESLKNRAFSHMLMSALAAGLTALGYLGHLSKPLSDQYNTPVAFILLAIDAIVGVVAIAVLTSAARELYIYFASRSQS